MSVEKKKLATFPASLAFVDWREIDLLTKPWQAASEQECGRLRVTERREQVSG